MDAFWKYRFNDNAAFIETFDEMPLWSAYAGKLILDHFPLKTYSTLLDIGSGAGFPLFEIAERLGNQTRCYGIDPWKNAQMRASLKKRNWAIENVELIESSAHSIPLADQSVDAIISNLGLNNFENVDPVLLECKRLMHAESILAICSNTYGHWAEFYKIFEDVLHFIQLPELASAIVKEAQHRKSKEELISMFENGGFEIIKTIEECITMRFLNGTAFLNHHFIKVGWLGSWLSIIPEYLHEKVFSALEVALNDYATEKGELNLSVPMLYIECKKA